MITTRVTFKINIVFIFNDFLIFHLCATSLLLLLQPLLLSQWVSAG